MVDVSSLGLLVIVIIGVVLLVLLRKRFFALLLDVLIGTVVYLALLFLINWVGLTIPLLWAEIGYPIMLIIFIIYHIITNTDIGKMGKSFGGW